MGMRRWVRGGGFSYGRTRSTSWDARDTHRTEMLFLHCNRSRMLALITAVPGVFKPEAGGFWPDGTDVGNAASVQYASESASRKINSVTAISKEGKSDPLPCQESSQLCLGNRARENLQVLPHQCHTPKAKYLGVLGEAVIREHFNYPLVDWIEVSGDKM